MPSPISVPRPAPSNNLSESAGLSVHRHLPTAHPYYGYLGPGLPIPQSLDVLDHHIGTLLLPAVAFLTRRDLPHHARREFPIQRFFYGRLDVLQ